MSNAARLAIPGTGDNGKVPQYDEANDEWDLVTITPTGGSIITPSGTNLAALEAAVDAASAGDTVRLTAGTTYTHSGVWIIDKAGITIDATGAILVASTETASAVQIAVDDVTWVGGTLQVTSTSRGNTLDHHRIVLDGCDGARVYWPRIEGSKAVGIFAYGATNFVIDRPVILNTEADTLHITAGAHHGLVLHPFCGYGGDDGVAIVSYAGDAAAVTNIDVVGARVWWQQGGRGLTVVGGETISFTDCEVVGSNGGAVYIATENALGGTRDVDGVTIVGCKLINNNTNASLDHGAICVVAELDGSDISNVAISGVEIHGTRPAANGHMRVLTPGTGTITNMDVTDIRVFGVGPGYLDWDESGGQLSITGSEFNGEIVVSTTWDAGSVTGPDGMVSTTVTATGATVGDEAHATLTTATGTGIALLATVTATDTVRVYLLNVAASGSIDPGSGTLTVHVRKFG